MEPSNVFEWVFVVLGYAVLLAFAALLWFAILFQFIPDEWLFPDEPEQAPFDPEAELRAMESERRAALRDLAAIRRRAEREMELATRYDVIEGTATEMERRR